jgi:hypothetical protein
VAFGLLGAVAGCRVGYEALPGDLLDTGAIGSGASAASGGLGKSGDSSGGSNSTQGGDVGAGAQATQGGAGDPGEAGAAALPDAGGDTGGTSGSGGTSAGSAGTSAGSGGSGQGATCRTATFDGHDYEHCDNPATFADAAADCDARGMRLVKLETEAEQIWVHSMIPMADQANNSTTLWRWLGGDALVTAGEWSWSDGELFWSGGNNGAAVGGAYTNWNGGRPLNNGDCMAMQARSGVWHAQGCTDPRPYVCELY